MARGAIGPRRPDRSVGRPDRVGHGRGAVRRGDAFPDRRVRSRAARQGGDPGRARGPCRRHARARPASRARGALAGRRRHRRRSVDVGQHLHDGGDRGRRGRSSCGQARQPVRFVEGRCRRRPRGARSPARPHARPGRRGGDENGHHFLLRARLPPGAAPRRGTSPRARHRHDVQLPRSARPPREAGRPSDRLRRRPDGAADGRCLRTPRRGCAGSSAATTASTS